jgi:hypothetical protein
MIHAYLDYNFIDVQSDSLARKPKRSSITF